MADPLTGTIGGRYALCGEIASGGMATVHLARQIGAAGFARIVAIKRLHERYARDPEFVAMFLDEARIVARVRHPNVVQTIDVVAEDGELFLVMEYVHGESLLRVMQVARKANVMLPVPVVSAIMVGALHGLHEAHDARSETGVPLGIVHRDVSPHNVLVGVDGVARVLDFGVAKASERIQTTHDGELKGKLSYMAPEQITNMPIDRRTDVYAAGVVCWEALTGTKLFAGGNEGAVLNQILLEEPRQPTSLNRAIPAEIEAIVMRALSRDPAARFASAREMAMAIERATPLATPSEVGALVSTSCASSITPRAAFISSVELRTSSSNLKDAVDSLRTLSLVGSRPDLPSVQTVPPPPAAAAAAPFASVRPRPANAGTFPPPVMLERSATSDGRAGLHLAPASSGTNMAILGAAGQVSAGRIVTAAISAAVLTCALAVGAGYAVVSHRRADRAPGGNATSSANDLGGAAAIVPAADGGPLLATSSAVAATSCPDGMALVPGGRFFMGSDDDLPAERPAHKVILHAYCMDKLEVTTDAYRACSDRGDCKRAGIANKWADISAAESRIYDPLCNANDASRGAHPINCVDWNMADRFCKADGKRLPTEAEWEFAARGSDGRKYPWGDIPPSAKLLNACGAECVSWGRKHGTSLDGMFAESDAWATTAPVGSFPLGASRWGIQDMVGNVWEWVADYYAPYEGTDQDDPTGPPTGATRAMRGGSWNGGYADWVRPTFRFHDAAETRSHGVGFRCAKTL